MLTCVLKLFRRYCGYDDAWYGASDRPARNTFAARICAGVSGRTGVGTLPGPKG